MCQDEWKKEEVSAAQNKGKSTFLKKELKHAEDFTLIAIDQHNRGGLSSAMKD